MCFYFYHPTTQANVGSVLEQLDTLQELKCKFESDIQEYGRNSTQVLEKSIIGECKMHYIAEGERWESKRGEDIV